VKNTNIEHSDYEALASALQRIKEVNSKVESHMHLTNSWAKIFEIEKNIKDLPNDCELLTSGRLFLHEGNLFKICRKSVKPRYFYLFSDMLLYTSKGGHFHGSLDLTGATFEDMVDTLEIRNRFTIKTSKKSFVVYATSQKEKQQWLLADSQRPKKKMPSRQQDIDPKPVTKNSTRRSRASTLTHMTASVWIRDKDAKVCMICSLKFTTLKRRHHCRSCGKVVCENCSKYKGYVTNVSDKKVRICLNCRTGVIDPEAVDSLSSEYSDSMSMSYSDASTTRERAISTNPEETPVETHKPIVLKTYTCYKCGR